jgi:hypothetical protein
VLVHLFAPHSGQFGLRGQRSHSSRSAALLGHSLDASGLGFDNEALNGHLRIGGGFGGGLLMNGKLLLLQFSNSFGNAGISLKLAGCGSICLVASFCMSFGRVFAASERLRECFVPMIFKSGAPGLVAP